MPQPRVLDDLVGVVVRQEKIVEEVVDAEQAVAGEDDGGVLDVEEAFALNLGERRGEAFENVDAELVAEVGGLHAAEFHLEDEFADHAFFFGGFEGALDRHAAGGDGGIVVFDFGEVLVVDAFRMGEGSHAEAEQVGAAPQRVAVEELGALRVFHRGP